MSDKTPLIMKTFREKAVKTTKAVQEGRKPKRKPAVDGEEAELEPRVGLYAYMWAGSDKYATRVREVHPGGYIVLENGRRCKKNPASRGYGQLAPGGGFEYAAKYRRKGITTWHLTENPVHTVLDPGF